MQDQVRGTQESSEQVIGTVAGGQLTFTLADLRGLMMDGSWNKERMS